MNSKLQSSLLVLVFATGLPFGATASDQLAQRYGCAGCHAADAPRVGPSWTAIRTKYKDGLVDAAQLAQSIKAGSKGKWGAIPMPPQAALPQADAQTLARFILDVK